MKKENAQQGAQSVLVSESEYSTTSHMEVFNNAQFGDLSVIKANHGKPMFIATEVALALGYKNPHDAIIKFCKKAVLANHENSRQSTKIIPESDLYRLIMKSTLPSAEAFEEWVFERVLPSIRKHGGYTQGQEHMSAEQLMAKALLVAESTINEKQRENERLIGVVNDLTQQFVEGQTIPDFCKQFNGVDTQQVMATLARIGYLRDEGYHDVESGRQTHTWRVNSSSRDKHFSEKPSHEYKPGKFSYKITVLKTGAKLLLKLYRTLRLPMKKDWDKKLHHTLPQQ